MIEAIIGFEVENNRKKNEQKKSLFVQFEIQILNRIPTAAILWCWARMPNLHLFASEQNGQKNIKIQLLKKIQYTNQIKRLLYEVVLFEIFGQGWIRTVDLADSAEEKESCGVFF